MNRAGRLRLAAPGLLAGWMCLGLLSCEQSETGGKDDSGSGDKAPVGAEPAAPDIAVVSDEEPAPLPDPDPATTPTPTPNPGGERTGKPVPVAPGTDPGQEGEPPRERWSLAQAGFAAHLPPDTDLYFSARELSWFAKALEEMGVEGGLASLLEMGPMEELADGIPSALGKEILAELKAFLPEMLAEEAFVATRGLSELARSGMKLVQDVNRTMGEELTRSALDEGFSFFFLAEGIEESQQEQLNAWLRQNARMLRERAGLALFVGGRVPDDTRGEWVKKIAGRLQAFVAEEENARVAEWEQAGVAWSGFEIPLGEIEGLLEVDPPDGLDEEAWAEFVATIRSLDLVVACAEVDDFVLLTTALGREAVVLAEKAEESLAAEEGFGFHMEFAAESVYGSLWANRGLLSGFSGWTSYLPLCEGIEAGLKKTENLKVGKALAKAMGEFNRHWRARRKTTLHDLVGVVVVDDGIRLETRGGRHGRAIDLNAPLSWPSRLTGLDDRLFLRAHWKKGDEFVEDGEKQFGAGMKVLALITEELLERAIKGAEDDPDPDDADKPERLRRWKRDIVKALDDLRAGFDNHFAKALGQERALVVDLDGAMIPAIGVEEELLEKGKIPRAAYLRAVRERPHLGEAWMIWNEAVTSIFGIMAEQFDQPIPFPDTMSADKNDLRTHYFGLPFVSDDFLPSVSVSDKWFFLGSSKNFSELLYEHLENNEADVPVTGMVMEVNTDPLWRFCEVWLEIKAVEWERMLEMQAEEKENGEGRPEIEPEPGDEDAPEADAEPAVPEGGEAREFEGEDLRDLLEEAERAERAENPAKPIQPEDLDLRPGEHENPLLEEFMGDEGAEAPHEHLGEDAARIEAEEMRQLALEGALAEEETDELYEFLKLFGEEDGTVSGAKEMLERLRWIRGLSYRRWLEDGVPRGSLRLRWAPPGDERPE